MVDTQSVAHLKVVVDEPTTAALIQLVGGVLGVLQLCDGRLGFENWRVPAGHCLFVNFHVLGW